MELDKLVIKAKITRIGMKVVDLTYIDNKF
jgi:hypothetical protein